MSGMLPILYLLSHNTALQMLVNATKIVPGDLPLQMAPPAINVEQIDGNPHNSIALIEPNKTWRDRIQVSAHVYLPPSGQGYPGLNSIMNAIVAACPNQRGTVNGVSVQSIIVDTRGPFLPVQETSRVSQSQDFIVWWKS